MVSTLSQPGIEGINQAIQYMGGSPAQQNNFDWLKVGHVIGYASLGTSLFLAARSTTEIKHPVVFALAICFTYACTDEFHQLFVPGRASGFLDVLLDTLAAMIIVEIIHLSLLYKSE